MQYSQGHGMVSHCDWRIAHLDDLDMSLSYLICLHFLHLESCLLSPKGISKSVNRLTIPNDISVSIGGVICLSQWFIMVCPWLYCKFHINNQIGHWLYITSVVFSWYSGFPRQQWSWPPRYDRDIVESVVRHHTPILYIIQYRSSVWYDDQTLAMW